jgi:hypothetical protein
VHWLALRLLLERTGVRDESTPAIGDEVESSATMDHVDDHANDDGIVQISIWFLGLI